jgi:hypothetical protein
MTVKELIEILNAMPQDAEVKAFEPFDPNGPCLWTNPFVSFIEGEVHIEPNY